MRRAVTLLVLGLHCVAAAALAGESLLSSIRSKHKQLDARASAAVPRAAGASTPKVIGWFTNWSQYRSGACKFMPEDILPIAGRLTHVHYAFAKLDGSGNVTPIEWDDCPSGAWSGCQGTKGSTLYERMMAVRAKHPHLKLLISIGGWTWGSVNTCPIFSQMVSSAASRTTFVQQAVQYARTFGWDGLSIDYEYPGYVPRGCKPSDTANFKTLMAALRDAITADAAKTGKAALLLAAATAAGLPEIAAEEPANFAPYVDYLSVMTYDYHGAWENVTGVNTPLVEETPGDGFSIMDTLEAYAKAGVPSSKMVLGFGTYGRTWDVSKSGCVDAKSCGILTPATGSGGSAGLCTKQAGVLGYNEIVTLLAATGTTEVYNNTLDSPYAYAASGNPWVGYDNVQSIKAKAALIAKHGLGGAMAWSLDTDDFTNGYPLMNAIASVLEGDKCPGGGDCSNHGLCLQGNTCQCDPGWDGADCATCTCAAAPGGASCNGHGSCHHNTTSDACQCTCEAGWVGTDCGQSNVPASCTAAHALTPASGYWTAAVSVTTTSALQGWAVTWTFTGDSTLSSCWGAPSTVKATMAGKNVTVAPLVTVDVPAGGTVSFTCGANAKSPGSSPTIHLNGVACPVKA